MCTSVSIKNKNNEVIFGRSMDFSYEINPEVYVAPNSYEWNNQINNQTITNQYKFMATGQNIGHIAFADGFNERGLGVAALYFEGYAKYNNDIDPNKINIAAIDLVNYLLGSCENIADIVYKLQMINVVGAEDDITHSVAPLHWIAVDKYDDCITIEYTKQGLEIHDNPLKVLANSPDFNWHMTNLRNYINLSPNQVNYSDWDNVKLFPFSQGGGSFGLPGDFTSPSRFVRIAFQKSLVNIPDNVNDAINVCFNMMKNVSVTKGIVVTPRDTYDYTQYTVFMNLKTGDYYFNTYYNNQIVRFNINDYNDNKIISLGKLKQAAIF